MKKKNGFTIVEIIVSLVILVAIGFVASVGLNKVFDKSKTDDYDTFVNKVISSADVYLTNNSLLASQLQSDRGYVVIEVTDLIEEGLIDEDLVNPETGERLGDQNDILKASLDVNGILNFEYPAESVDEPYLEAQNVVLEYGDNFMCSDIASYESLWGTPALRFITADGVVSLDYQITDIITDIVCDANLSVPGTYSLDFIYQIPGTENVKELKRSLIVSPSMDDIVAINGAVSKEKVVINNPITASVNATNRRGETFSLDNSKYNVDLATNVAGTFNPVITYLGLNSDQSSPTSTISYEVMDNLSEITNIDDDCVKESDNSCWYTESQDGNYLSYSNKIWRIYKKNTDNSINLILNNVTGDTYAFTDLVDSYVCDPAACCNSNQSLSSSESSYLLTQDPNGLNTYLTLTFQYALTDFNKYLKTAAFDITGYSTTDTATITQKVGLLSYAEYSKISKCLAFNCESSYLNSASEWGLGTFYEKNVYYEEGYNLAEGYFSRYVFPRYNKSLYVNSNGDVSQANGSFKLRVSNTDRIVTTNGGHKLGVKPVIVLNANTKITGGDGSYTNPYMLE
ncbi:MAG: prepilin-type N-terminal cleavage/methylation domain-containing protein [Bacilli bacterium]|nr:prepilin-type N-terminal cleavage/methylation domain-containing protein [Bacilli bacterium]